MGNKRQLVRADVSTAGVLFDLSTLTGSFATIASFPGPVRKLIIQSTSSGQFHLSLDGGTTLWVTPLANKGYQIDFDETLQWSGDVSAKHNGSAPTGFLSLAVIKGR